MLGGVNFQNFHRAMKGESIPGPGPKEKVLKTFKALGIDTTSLERIPNEGGEAEEFDRATDVVLGSYKHAIETKYQTWQDANPSEVKTEPLLYEDFIRNQIEIFEGAQGPGSTELAAKDGRAYDADISSSGEDDEKSSESAGEPASKLARLTDPEAVFDAASEGSDPRPFKVGEEVEFYEESSKMKGVIKDIQDDKVTICVVEISDQELDEANQKLYENHEITVANLQKAIRTSQQPLKTKATEGSEMVHYHPKGTHIKATEYIKPRGKIDITSHGLGSGVYGIVTPGEIPQQEETVAETIDIGNPFYVQSVSHKDQITTMSKRLQAVAAIIAKHASLEEGKEIDKLPLAIDLSFGSESSEEVNDSIKYAKRVFNEVGITVEANQIKECIKIFLNDYFTSETAIPQPINYLMTSLGYDGLYLAYPEAQGSFQTGSVWYRHPQENIAVFTTDGATQQQVL